MTAGENRWNLGSWSRLLDLLEARTPKVAGGSTAVEIAGFAGARTPKVAGGSTAVVRSDCWGVEVPNYKH